MEEITNLNYAPHCKTLLKLIFGYVPYQFEEISVDYLEKAISEVLYHYPVTDDKSKLNANDVYYVAISNALSDLNSKCESLEALEEFWDENDMSNIPEWQINKLKSFCDKIANNELAFSDFYEICCNGDLDSRCVLLSNLDKDIYAALHIINEHTDLFSDLEYDINASFSDYYSELEDIDYHKAGYEEYQKILAVTTLISINSSENLDCFSDAIDVYGYEFDFKGDHLITIFADSITVNLINIQNKWVLSQTYELWDFKGQNSLTFNSNGEIINVD